MVARISDRDVGKSVSYLEEWAFERRWLADALPRYLGSAAVAWFKLDCSRSAIITGRTQLHLVTVPLLN